ncbi:hypothetical protein BOTBODRAFT_142926 [Botryobasidium botryosum FD-172 SS1]|uniref:Zn(2)-C6 fungal-type domain-containing protein n=1 Tax=Botryobasidium botryosum (strain FD-172 SS1) TaxID=930990 RepID=A0A067N6H2_BOTB1|nr:hypothetical protein BOTBODRAFT_142926 [Botryobasidium botryosum FD-172 SS1]
MASSRTRNVPPRAVSTAARKLREEPEKKTKKTTVRTKEGCLTCRLRHKTCDKIRDSEGRCKTCVRFKIECLGFTDKRLDWMKDKTKVKMCTDAIRDHMIAHSMIKGKARPENPLPARSFLSLNELVFGEEAYASSLSEHISSGSSHSGSSYADDSETTKYSSSPVASAEPSYHGNGYDMHNADDFHLDLNPTMFHDEAVGALDSYHGHFPPHSPSNFVVCPQLSPALISGFSPLYHYRPVENVTDDYYDYSSYPTTVSSALVPSLPELTSLGFTPFHAGGAYTPGTQKYRVHYFHNVFKFQYYLVRDHDIKTACFQLGAESPADSAVSHAMDAVSAQHHRLNNGAAQVEDGTWYIAAAKRILDMKKTKRGFTEADAMAGLHGVSYYLFEGGTSSEWDDFLAVPCAWLEDQLQGGRFHSWEPLDKKTMFIIGLTAWQDIFSSITLSRKPRLMDFYPTLFRLPGLSMTDVMGCDNETLYRIAQIAELAAWKDAQRDAGCLSIPELVRNGQAIEACLAAHCAQPSIVEVNDSALYTQQSAAKVFQAAARVFLHSVMSGCNPNVDEIKDAVTETIKALKKLSSCAAAEKPAVDRSVVFPICISGCLTDDAAQRQFLLGRVQMVAKNGPETENVGNCTQVAQLMNEVWRKRDTMREGGVHGEVCWRETMKELGWTFLLV